MSLNIIKQTGTANTTYSPGREIKWLVIHYSASTSSKKGAASGMCSWSGNPSAQGSADFAVDDETMYQYNGDIENRYCWAVGGSKYSVMSTSLGGQYYSLARNANSISIELSSNKKDKSTMDVTDDDWYLTEATINNGVKLAAYLMKKYNIGMDHVIMHTQVTGKWCPQPWTKNEAALKGWYDFRKRLQKEYDGTELDGKIYRVRKDWKDSDSQIFAGTLDGAKRVADEYPGYLVFDPDGKVLYGSVDAVSSVAPTTVASGIPFSKEDYLKKVSDIAVALYKDTRILPSVVIAQCCIETGYEIGTDSTELVKRNNLLGMKSDLINSTWKEYTVWDGTSFTKRTPEVYSGVLTYINDSFRVYKDYENCIRDYEMFLMHVKNNDGYKYRRIVGKTDPEEVITLISKGGYATDPSYITKVMKLIKEKNLTKYDIAAGVSPSEENLSIPTATLSYYRVAEDYKNGKYIGQIGAYTSRDNALASGKASNLNVYDASGKVIHQATKIANKAYRVRCGRFSVKQNATNLVNLLASNGIGSMLVKDGDEWDVQVGVFSVKENAEAYEKEIKNKGFDVMIVEIEG